MKKNKSLIKTQRKSLDEKLRAFDAAKTLIPPKSGWIKPIREALGMTTQQLAKRMGIQQSGVSLLEKREASKKVSLETLQKAAQALGCDLVYALVPKNSLETIVDSQARESAKKILQRTSHSMGLEMQMVSSAEGQMHEEELVAEIKKSLDRRLWGDHE